MRVLPVRSIVSVRRASVVASAENGRRGFDDLQRIRQPRGPVALGLLLFAACANQIPVTPPAGDDAGVVALDGGSLPMIDAGEVMPTPDAGMPEPDAGEPTERPRHTGSPVPTYAVDISVWTDPITDPDVDCMWDAGVRHIIIGTQFLEVTRQQIKIAVRGGMTIDLYVYLYWNEDISAQVQEALDLAEEFRQVDRIWLDVEEDPGGLGYDALKAHVDEAVAAAGDFPIGIYTGWGYWHTYMRNTTDYAEHPLWYARYDDIGSLDTWEDDRFGGWALPWGKQYYDNHRHLCDLALDHNMVQWDIVPDVVVSREIPPDDGDPPPAPTDLHPDEGLTITTEVVRMTAPAIREATGYEIRLEHWNGSAFVEYLALPISESHRSQFPTLDNRTYRFRMRAENAHGFGPWSAWAFFDYGTVRDRPPIEVILAD